MHVRRLVLVFVLVLAPTVTGSAFAEGRDPIRLSPSSRRFALDDQQLWAQKGELLEVLRSQLQQDSLGIVDVLSEANRAAKERSGRVRLFRDKRKKEKKKRAYRAEHSFVWDRDDRDTTSWYPQGLTGSADAVAGGVLGDRRVLLVSWYARKNPEKGARISLVDVTDPREVVYRHMLLVEPVESDDGVTFRAVRTHAGGIAWYKNYLYVADTAWGVRVFDTSQILRAEADPSKARIGARGGRAYAHDYRFVIPMVGHYRQRKRGNFNFSFVSIDRTRRPHSLWGGEYDDGSHRGYATRFPLNEVTGRLDTDGEGPVTSQETFRLNRTHTQGFLAAHGQYYYNHSYQRDQYRIHVQKPDGYSTLRGGFGLEDLHYDGAAGRLWFLTEHPRSRGVFYISSPHFNL